MKMKTKTNLTQSHTHAHVPNSRFKEAKRNCTKEIGNVTHIAFFCLFIPTNAVIVTKT